MNNDSLCCYVVDSRTQVAEQLRRSEKEYQNLFSYLASLKEKTGSYRQRAFLPLGPLAYASGTLRPPEKVLVLLGENYFARVSLDQALAIAHRRILFIRKRLSELNLTKVAPKLERTETKKDEKDLILERWNKGIQLLEQYLQASDVVNLCEEYRDSFSKEPARVHGLKEEHILNRDQNEEEVVDWSYLLDVSGTTLERGEPSEKLPESIWTDLERLAIAEASSSTADAVDDPIGYTTESVGLPMNQERSKVKEPFLIERKLSAAGRTASGKPSKINEETQLTNSQRNSSRKTFCGQIKERKSLSS